MKRKFNLSMILLLICSLVLYFVANKVIMAITGIEYNSYAQKSMSLSELNVFRDVYNAYRLFAKSILKQNGLLIPTGVYPDDERIEIYEAMPVFPANGSIIKIDDMIFVRIY